MCLSTQITGSPCIWVITTTFAVFSEKHYPSPSSQSISKGTIETRMFAFTRVFNRNVARSAVAFSAQNRKMTMITQPVMPGALQWENAVIRIDSVKKMIADLLSPFADGLLFLKRTFQPSLIRMKRKHGFLARLRSRNGLKILARRRAKGRARLSN